MKIALLALVLVLGSACSGGKVEPSSTPVVTQVEKNVTVQPQYEGIPFHSIGEQKTIIRTASDYNFYYRAVRGSEPAQGEAESVLAVKDVVLVVHNVTYQQNRFNISNATILGNTQLNIYYYFTSDSRYSYDNQVKFYWYLVDKTISTPNFIQVIP